MLTIVIEKLRWQCLYRSEAVFPQVLKSDSIKAVNLLLDIISKKSIVCLVNGIVGIIFLFDYLPFFLC